MIRAVALYRTRRVHLVSTWSKQPLARRTANKGCLCGFRVLWNVGRMMHFWCYFQPRSTPRRSTKVIVEIGPLKRHWHTDNTSSRQGSLARQAIIPSKGHTLYKGAETALYGANLEKTQKPRPRPSAWLPKAGIRNLGGCAGASARPWVRCRWRGTCGPSGFSSRGGPSERLGNA